MAEISSSDGPYGNCVLNAHSREEEAKAMTWRMNSFCVKAKAVKNRKLQQSVAQGVDKCSCVLNELPTPRTSREYSKK
eukprot:6212184-Pleurochrysis_carterae.AAC.1